MQCHPQPAVSKVTQVFDIQSTHSEESESLPRDVCTDHAYKLVTSLPPHSIGCSSVTWSYLTAKQAEKCSLAMWLESK